MEATGLTPSPLIRADLMPEPNDLDTVEDIKLWIAGYAARADEREKALDAAIYRLEARLAAHDGRLSGLEKRVIWLTSLAAGGGGIAGSIISNMVGG